MVEEVLLPEPVKACPEAWRRIGEERSDSLDYQLGRIFIRRLVRPVFVKITDRDAAPVIAKLPPHLRDGLTTAPGLIAHVLISKYCEHLPFYRQEKILGTRHGVEIGRNTLCRWAELAAFWLKPLYRLIHVGQLSGGYLVDQITASDDIIRWQREAYQLPQLVLSVYQQARDEYLKVECLDTIDRMLAEGFGGIDAELVKFER